ncbi:hypothetical protein PHYPSEUDO_011203 [Phytophthora pseudosyringae]|uniref:Uncharacterized protein n=1 Tax=Phytophthora pseudosyringae TaxID=221518 RepID=A0A8T1WL74_9STRA|nr:hypothetical protein PHYPSEUDO_011203 [Phytophthora pseudosyringae]
MGSSDSKLSAQARAQQEEQCAIQMKNPAAAAAMEALENAFLMMCTSKKNLFKPIFEFQARARTKSLGENYWSSASKKRVKILDGKNDVFEAASSRLQANQRQSGALPKIAPDSPTHRTPNAPSAVKNQPTHSTSTIEPKNSSPEVGTPVKPDETDTKSVDSWIKAETLKEPLIQTYLAAFRQAYVAESLLQSQKLSAGPGQDQLLPDLRYSVAVSTKRRDEARSALEELWEKEQSYLITERHEVVTTLVKGISTRTLHKQSGKKTSEKVVRSYTQKKLDIEENAIRGRFAERWQTLERTAHLQAASDLDASRKAAATPGGAPAKMLLQQKSTHGVSEPNKTRVVPTSQR